MVKTKAIVIRINEEQDKLLNAKTREKGFLTRSEFIRSIIFAED